MTVKELRTILNTADDDKDVVVRIPMVKSTNGIIKDVVDARPNAVDSMLILNIDKLNKPQEVMVYDSKRIDE